MKLGIVDYNMGNLASVKNSLNKVKETFNIDVEVFVESKAENLNSYDKVILPGVGAFGDAMLSLKSTGMDSAIKEFAKSGKILFGICLGMQLLFDSSEESVGKEGLSLIKGEVKKFDISKFSEKLKIPQMGWNTLQVQKESKIFKNLPQNFYLYFVHSYHAQCEEKYIIGKTDYGYTFPSAVNKDNIFGLQPHPEKSHDKGLLIVKNFLEL